MLHAGADDLSSNLLKCSRRQRRELQYKHSKLSKKLLSLYAERGNIIMEAGCLSSLLDILHLPLDFADLSAWAAAALLAFPLGIPSSAMPLQRLMHTRQLIGC